MAAEGHGKLKEAIPQKALLGIGGAVIVLIIGFVAYYFHASDPAAQGPIPYKKFDYGAHIQEQAQQYGNRQAVTGANATSAPGATATSAPGPR